MKCPNDSTTLLLSERRGIEIDYCPECRGVWLDRGELDKLIEQDIATQAPVSSYDAPRHESLQYRKKHKRESFLGEMFDF